MSASTTDKITHIAVGTLTELAAPGYTVGDTSINGLDLSTWPTADGVFFGMDIVDSSGVRVDGSYTEKFGIVSGNTIGSLQHISGPDQDYPAGSTTRMMVLLTGAWANALVDALQTEHDKEGGHADINPTSVTTPSATVTDLSATNLTVGGVPFAPFPTGALLPFGGSTAPTGYLLCDGSAVSRTTYAALFTAVGTAYGTGDGTTTFNLPNGKGRSFFGLDSSQSEFSTLGKTGGQKTVMAHSHGVTDPGHVHGVGASAQASLGGAGNVVVDNNGVKITGSSTTGISIQSTGSGSNNLNPYFVGNWIIKY